MVSPVEAILSEAEHALQRRHLAAARAAFDQAQALGADPDHCSAGRWLAAMLGGHFASAWRESDAIRRHGASDPHRFWTGEDLAGKRVIVRCLHGFGDAVQMLRYAPKLRQRAAEVVWEVPPRLLPLAPCFHGVQQAITWGNAAPGRLPAWDAQIEVMELPYIFCTTLSDLPIATKYLTLPPNAVSSAATAMGRKTKPRIGLVWEAGEWNTQRSLPPALLTPLLQREDADLWNLQGTGASPAFESSGMRHANTLCGDGLLPLAATIAHLDLVVTVDTLAAHLAGALGVPVWLMLQQAADWRWMTGRADSPWYPSMRLFRQPTDGDWTAVVAAVDDALDRFLPLLFGEQTI